MTLDQFIQYISKSKYNNYLYHFTDESNLPSIYEHGILSTKQRQLREIIPCCRGGNEGSYYADNHNDIEGYVCLSFTDNHPLGYIAKQNERLPKLLYLKIDPQILLTEGVMFANGVANANETELRPISDAIDLIDKELIYEKPPKCLRSGKSEVQSAKKCEILVPNIVRVTMILGKV